MEFLNFLIDTFGVPFSLAICLLVIFAVMQVVGEIIEIKGKLVPEIMKIRKYFKRKKEERKRQEEVAVTLEEVKVLLADVNKHYSKDNITKRDKWIHWVDHQAEIYDTSIADLRKKMDKNTEITLELFIELKRNFLLDFAAKVADESYPASKEQFNRAFKVYDDYEKILAENNLENGQVTVAHRVISEAYAVRLHNHSFLEDIRGYTTNLEQTDKE